MKPWNILPAMLLLLIGAFSLLPFETFARLPKPVRITGTVLDRDIETKTLLLKPGKGKKPFLLDWNNETEFRKNDLPASAAQLTAGTTALIYYKDVSFHNPLLKKVVWTDGPQRSS